eukprot:RCo009836
MSADARQRSRTPVRVSVVATKPPARAPPVVSQGAQGAGAGRVPRRSICRRPSTATTARGPVGDGPETFSRTKELLLKTTHEVDRIFVEGDDLRRKLYSGAREAQQVIELFEQWQRKDLGVGGASSLDPKHRQEVLAAFNESNLKITQWTFLDQAPVKDASEFSDKLTENVHPNPGPLVTEDTEGFVLQEPADADASGGTSRLEDETEATSRAMTALEKIAARNAAGCSAAVAVVELVQRRVAYAADKLKVPGKLRALESMSITQLKERATFCEQKMHVVGSFVLNIVYGELRAVKEQVVAKETRIGSLLDELRLARRALEEQRRTHLVDRRVMVRAQATVEFHRFLGHLRDEEVAEAEEMHRRATSPPVGRAALVHACLFHSQDYGEGWWQKSTEAMDRSLALFNAIAGAVLRQSRGYLCSSSGDGVVVAFSSAADALHWCVEMQARMLKAPWPPSLNTEPVFDTAVNGMLWNGPALRVGMHFGAVKVVPISEGANEEPASFHGEEPQQVVYVGASAAVAQALMHAARRGEILLSEDAYAAVKDREIAREVEFTSLGPTYLGVAQQRLPVYQASPLTLKERALSRPFVGPEWKPDGHPAREFPSSAEQKAEETFLASCGGSLTRTPDFSSWVAHRCAI